jgi:uncharacterized protein (UPF0332 family)
MKNADFLKQKIGIHLKRRQLMRSEEYTRLEKPFLAKARKNFTVASVLMRISDKGELKKTLGLGFDFEVYDWAIIVAYYSMYTSALAALAKLGYKSKSHAATLAVLEYNYVYQQKGLEIRHLEKLSKAYMLSEELINKLIRIKTRRETAQYDATPSISRENAVSSLDDAEEFITRIEEILA